MESLVQDLKFSLKLLFKDKGFTFVAILTLALCIGANTAIFSVLNTVLLRPLPFPESGRIVTLYNRYPGVGVQKGANGVPDYLDRKQETAIFEELALIGFSGYDIGLEGSPERVSGLYVTPSLFRLLRVPPALGRAFTEDEAVLGKEKVVILSNGLWKQKFGGSRDVIGTDIRLSGTPYRIVGVMPEGFEFLSRDARLWVPFAFTPQQTSDDARHNNSWSMVGRLRPGISLVQAQQRIDGINQRNLERFPKYRKLLENARFSTMVSFLQAELVEDIRPTLYLLQGSVAFVLMIGCLNVANLMLVRSNVRLKELAVRSALGAGRWRLARQLLTESVLLAVLGGILGLLVGYWGVRLLKYLGAERLPSGISIAIDGFVLGFTLLVAIATGLLFGTIPVFHVLRTNLNEVFHQCEGTGTAERPAMMTRALLAVAQVSIAFVLLVGAGLMITSFVRVLRVSPGFKAEGVITASVGLPQTRYADDAKARSFADRALENVRSLPGVKAAGLTNYLPFSGNNNSSVITIVGRALGPGENPPVPGFGTIGGGYFRVMGIPLLQGRTFEESDTAEAQRVVIIDQFLARKYWPDTSPIGAKIRNGVDSDSPVATVVGVVGSVKISDLAEQNPVGTIYFQETLASAKVVVVEKIPIPPLSQMGLNQLGDFEKGNYLGVTYLDTYFLVPQVAHNESTHFHELCLGTVDRAWRIRLRHNLLSRCGTTRCCDGKSARPRYQWKRCDQCESERDITATRKDRPKVESKQQRPPGCPHSRRSPRSAFRIYRRMSLGRSKKTIRPPTVTALATIEVGSGRYEFSYPMEQAGKN
jgi:predicted permease